MREHFAMTQESLRDVVTVSFRLAHAGFLWDSGEKVC